MSATMVSYLDVPCSDCGAGIEQACKRLPELQFERGCQHRARCEARDNLVEARLRWIRGWRTKRQVLPKADGTGQEKFEVWEYDENINTRVGQWDWSSIKNRHLLGTYTNRQDADLAASEPEKSD